MNVFSAAHLGLAAFCAVMGALHVALWWAVRSERAHKWVALSFVGFMMLNLGLAGASVAAEGSLGDPHYWLLFTIPTALLLPPALAQTAWAVFDRPLTTGRKAALLTVTALMLPVAIQFTWFIATDSHYAASWEQARYANPLTAVPYQVGTLLLGTIWLIEPFRARKSMPTLAWAALIANLPCIGLLVREIMVGTGQLEGPTLIGVMGLPLGLFASASMVIRYVRVINEKEAARHAEDHYRRMARLGSGGMGELWLALRSGEGGFRRWVVVKRIRVDKLDEEMVERFLVEARIAARLHHPNVVSVYDLGQWDDDWYMVMEYLQGPSLWEILERCYEEETFAPIEIVAEIGAQIARGLECAHSHGVLHRDISPDNVIITLEGVAKLLDFGIAKESSDPERALTSSMRSDGTTLSGGVIGKAQYLAPERAIGEPSTVESDIYALGLLLVQLLGAPIPERGAELAGHPKPVSEHRPDVPPNIESICRRALAAHPKERYRSAEDLAHVLAELAAPRGPSELAQWIRKLCPRRFSVQRRLSTLGDPTPEAVTALLDELREGERVDPDVDPTAPDPPNTDPRRKSSKTTAVVRRSVDL